MVFAGRQLFLEPGICKCVWLEYRGKVREDDAAHCVKQKYIWISVITPWDGNYTVNVQLMVFILRDDLFLHYVCEFPLKRTKKRHTVKQCVIQ